MSNEDIKLPKSIVGDWYANYPWSAKENDGDQAFFGTYAKGEGVLR